MYREQWRCEHRIEEEHRGQADVEAMAIEWLQRNLSEWVGKLLVDGRDLRIQVKYYSHRQPSPYGMEKIVGIKVLVESPTPIIDIPAPDAPDWRPDYSVSEDYYAT